MKLTLLEINQSSRAWGDILNLSLPAKMSFIIEENIEILKNKNDLLLKKISELQEKYKDTPDVDYSAELEELSLYEVDVSIKLISKDEFVDKASAVDNNIIKASSIMLLDYMFKSAHEDEAQ